MSRAQRPSSLPEAVAEFLNGKSLKDFHEARSARVPFYRPVVESVDTAASRPDGAAAARADAGSSPAGATNRKLCPLDRHLMLADADYCWGCFMEWEAEDRAAKDREAGRVGHEPDDEGDDP